MHHSLANVPGALAGRCYEYLGEKEIRFGPSAEAQSASAAVITGQRKAATEIVRQLIEQEMP